MKESKPFLRKWSVFIIVSVLVGLIAGILFVNELFSFHPDDLKNVPATSEVFPTDSSFSVISFNIWRLCQPERVPVLVQALQSLEHDLRPASAVRSLPDIILFQELECQDATNRLRTFLLPTHWFGTNICARKRSGEPRTAVGIAVNRSRFEVVEEYHVDLGTLFLDHNRCALLVTIKPHNSQQVIHVISVHHSPHPLKYLQTQTMLKQLHTLKLLKADRVILGGDFNFTPRTRSYRLLTSVFTDPFPEDRGKTHWIGGRIDLVFTTEGLSLIRPLNRKQAYEIIQPAGLLKSLYQCPGQDFFGCPRSDHLPEGGIFTVKRS